MSLTVNSFNAANKPAIQPKKNNAQNVKFQSNYALIATKEEMPKLMNVIASTAYKTNPADKVFIKAIEIKKAFTPEAVSRQLIGAFKKVKSTIQEGNFVDAVIVDASVPMKIPHGKPEELTQRVKSNIDGMRRENPFLEPLGARTKEIAEEGSEIYFPASKGKGTVNLLGYEVTPDAVKPLDGVHVVAPVSVRKSLDKTTPPALRDRSRLEPDTGENVTTSFYSKYRFNNRPLAKGTIIDSFGAAAAGRAAKDIATFSSAV